MGIQLTIILYTTSQSYSKQQNHRHTHTHTHTHTSSTKHYSSELTHRLHSLIEIWSIPGPTHFHLNSPCLESTFKASLYRLKPTDGRSNLTSLIVRVVC